MIQAAPTPRQVFFPMLRYHDALAAVEWLGRAFGAVARDLAPEADGTVGHAELDVAGAVVILASEPAGAVDRYGEHAGRGWVYVAVDDPDALFERATAAGAEVVQPLIDTDYGSRDCSVRDPEGNLWSFGTYRPDHA
ncbi:MAG TPA: VOC family protein [Thermomicrobiales bacterium]|nr:VOC family protein [Thermomicrobiales bacterium]